MMRYMRTKWAGVKRNFVRILVLTSEERRPEIQTTGNITSEKRKRR
jgi:hypothetical protein